MQLAKRVCSSFNIGLSGYAQMNRHTQTSNEKKKKLV